MTTTKRLLRKLRGEVRVFRADYRGNTAVFLSLALVPVVVAIGAAVDYSRANSAKAQMQAAADSAALYAAVGNYSSDSQRVTAGTKAFNANYQPQFTSASPSVTIANNAVTVTATGNVSTTLLGVVGVNTVKVSVASTAQIGGGTTACVLALQTTNDAIFVHGSAGLKANCGIYSNSTSSNGIDFDGDSITTATSISVVGNYVKDSQALVTPTPRTAVTAMTDPLASLAAPSNATASCDHNGYEYKSGMPPLNPGVYCGGINIDGGTTATFNPGTYIIRGGQFNIGSSATVNGQGVFFYLTGQDANLNQGSSSNMNFTAPTSGTYKGILFFQDRAANTSANQFGGSSNSVIQGTVYFPNGTAEINCNGTVGASADWTAWVVKRLQLDSSATLQVTSKYSGSATPVPDALTAMLYGQKPFLMK